MAPTQSNLQPPSLIGEPIQIIQLEQRPNRPSKMVIEKTVLRKIMSEIGDREVAVITAAGPTRKGKSFLMNFMVKYLNNRKHGPQNAANENWIGGYEMDTPLVGFTFKNGVNPETHGLYIWSEPFILTRSDGTEVAVLLVDTQGIFDEETGEREWSGIIGLSLLLSSCLIYNIFTDLNEDVLSILNNFMKCGLLCTNDDEKCFEKLVFLIRDWNNPGQYKYGPVGGKKFIEDKLKPKKNMSEESKEFRVIIKKSFEEVDCFLFPPPGEKAKHLDFQGMNKELEKAFIDNMKYFVEDLLDPDNITSKRFGGQRIQAKTLLNYFEKYVEAFNSGNIKTVLLDAMAHATCADAEDLALRKFKELMEEKMSIPGLHSNTELIQFHNESWQSAIEIFSKQKLSLDEKLVNRYRNSLEANANKVYQELVGHYASKKESFALQAIEDSVTEFVKILNDLCSSTQFLTPDHVTDMVKKARDGGLEKFENVLGKQEQSFFDEYLPPMLERFQFLENQFREETQDKLNQVEGLRETALEDCLKDYKVHMEELISLIGQPYLEQEKLLEIHKKCSQDSFQKVKQITQVQDEAYVSSICNDLMSKITNELDSIARRNAEARDELNRANVDRVKNWTETEFKNISDQIDNEELYEARMLEDAFKTFRMNLKTKCVYDFKFTLTEFETFLDNIESIFEEMKNRLQIRQHEFRARALDSIAEAGDAYFTMFKTKLEENARAFSPDELKRIHNDIVPSVGPKTLKIPLFFTMEEKQEFDDKVKKQFHTKFQMISEFHNRKIHVIHNQVDRLLREYSKEYEQEQLRSCDQLLVTKSEISGHQEVITRNWRTKYIQEIEKYGQYLSENLLEKFNTEFKKIDSKVFELIAKKQKNEFDRAVAVFNFCLSRYDMKMEKSFGGQNDVTDKQIDTSHKYLKSKVIQKFHDEIEKRKIVSNQIDELVEKLEEKLESEIQKRRASNRERKELLIENKNRKIDTCFKFYCDQINSALLTTKSETELLRTQTNLSQAQLNQFHDDSDSRSKLDQMMTSYFEETVRRNFNQILEQQNCEMQELINKAKMFYSNSMKTRLGGNSVHEEEFFESIHHDCRRQAISVFHQNVDKSLTKAVIDSYEEQLIFVINAELNIFKGNEEASREQIDSEASELVRQLLSDFQIEADNIFKTAKRLDNLNEMYQTHIPKYLSSFSAKYSLPLESLRIKYDNIIRREMESIITKLINEFKSSEISPEDLKLEVDEAVRRYKQVMDKRIEDKSKFIDFLILKSYHNETLVAIRRRFETKKIRMTDVVDDALESALKHIFKKYLDENSLNAEMKDPAIGIDLGTTYSCVAVWTGKEVRVIPNEFRENTTPSYVRYGEDGKMDMVGKPAKNQAHETPRRTIFDVKRLIGRRFTDKTVKEDMKLWPFEVVAGGKNSPQVKIGSTLLPPEKVSSEVLKNLKKIAETYLGKPVKRAVITVPAYFDDGQRQATKDAGTLAGLEILGIINEPTAAAIAYRLQHTDELERKVLIYDFGGGTFDVSVLKMAGGKIEVKATGGDTHLGGEDIDSALVNYCVQEFKRQNGVDLTMLGRHGDYVAQETLSRKLRRIRHQCELGKCDLSGECRMVTITLANIHELIDLHVDLTREKFEEINAGLFNKTIQIVQKTIAEAKFRIDEIDDVVLVGGSTKIPKVQKLLENLFPDVGLKRTVHPDEAVAIGASIHAAILNGSWDQRKKFISLSDVTPLPLGIETEGDRLSIIIPKNTPVPVEKSCKYYTVSPAQTVASIRIFEGNYPRASKNHLLGEFELTGIPPRLFGREDLTVTMKVDENGILNVTAVCDSTGKEAQINIEESKGRLTVSDLKNLM